jgi:SAM-dependent methyltransferase
MANELRKARRAWQAAHVTGQGTSESIAAYDAQALRLVAEYEALDPNDYRATYSTLIPAGAGRLALDVGAGSGRDAAWLASLGFDVVAVEPASGMREAGQRLHSEAQIRWLDDRLPALEATHALGLSFDIILLSAVWQHVAGSDRSRAFRKLCTLLKPGGLLVITLRHGPAPADRPMHPVSTGEVEAFAREHGLAVIKAERAPATPLRPGVTWTTMCLALPDDGAGALPLLRGIILNDDKAATYKLGLLRAVARLADLTPSLARAHGPGDDVEVTLGAVALNWVRMYLPLVVDGLPQMPGNTGPDGLSFAKHGFRALMGSGLSATDLRIGATFAGERALAVAGAIGEAARTIAAMPANFTRYPNSADRVFGATYGRASRSANFALDVETLSQFGSLLVPGHVWRAMQRYGAWIEPLLVAEWARLTRGYAERQGFALGPGEVEAALAWVEPTRDVRVARDAALARLAAGKRLHCVWSARSLGPTSIDIDHCVPWSAWPCGDLWNLLPTHRTVNQHEKRDRLPSAATLSSARRDVVDWWEGTWRSDPVLDARFVREVCAALPVSGDFSTDAAFDALSWRRLRLQQDQQLAEWIGPRAA